MIVKEIMTKDPACSLAETSLPEVARMMVENDCGAIPVVNDRESKKPIGMLTDRDITVRTVAEGKNPLDLTAGDIMTENVVTVTPETSVEDCCNLMEERQLRRIAVVDEKGAVCGLVAQADVALNTDTHKTAQMVEKVSQG